MRIRSENSGLCVRDDLNFIFLWGSFVAVAVVRAFGGGIVEGLVEFCS